MLPFSLLLIHDFPHGYVRVFMNVTPHNVLIFVPHEHAIAIFMAHVHSRNYCSDLKTGSEYVQNFVLRHGFLICRRLTFLRFAINL